MSAKYQTIMPTYSSTVYMYIDREIDRVDRYSLFTTLAAKAGLQWCQPEHNTYTT